MLVYLVLGCVLESLSMVLLTVPIFAPMAISYGIEPLHFALVFILTLVVGMLTPPVGVLLFLMAGMTGLKVGEVIVEVAQEFMKTPQQVAQKLTSIKGEGRRSGYLMIADSDGNLRLVAVPLE